MVIVLVILTFIVATVVALIVQAQQRRAHVRKTVAVQTAAEPDHTERFFHAGHSWAVVDPTRNAILGVDSFAPLVIGRVESIDLPTEGMTVTQGQLFVTMHRKGRLLTLPAPLSGEVTHVNHKLHRHPHLVSSAPFAEGWIARIKPSNLTIEVSNLMKGITATLWRDALRTQLVQWFIPRFGTVLQDGGHFIENFSDSLSADEWNRLVKEFFQHTSTTEQARTKEHES